ncbi:organic cation transporter-like protein [Paramacrobiotus metropolitanus]|uniref:organic cation transporter-like protein n=1 Tax=Paramacrobiotus metropolitanus TaxID=2943436 RepID=UPI0024459CEA|nr:organic cation transporter-like protein [Paramacrobiotus metropolitanus]
MADPLIQNPDDILYFLGDPGRFQILQFILLSSQFIPIAMNDLIPIFYNIRPVGLYVNTLNETRDNYLGAQYYNLSTACTLLGQRNFAQTDHLYVYASPRQRSVVGDMDLVCDKGWLANLATAIYFFGQIIGSFGFGVICDRIGRRNPLLFCNVLFSALNAGLIFSADYIYYAVFLFFIGISRQGMHSSFFILMMEWIQPRRRGTWAAIAQFPFSLGVLLLALTGYLVQDWRKMQLVLTVSNFTALAYYWFAPESLKWLVLQNQFPRIAVICTRIARFNKITLSEEILQGVQLMTIQLHETQTKHRAYTMLDCIKTPYLRIFTFLTGYLWFAVFMSYFAFSFLVAGLVGNIYMNIAISGALELIPRALCILLASKFSNRAILTGHFLLTAALALSASVVPTAGNVTLAVVQAVLAQAARMSVVGCFPAVAVVTSELFPTVIRNSGFSWCSVLMRLGGMVAPQFIVLATITTFSGLPFVVISVTVILGAVVAILLPETTDMKMLSTIAEAEAFGKETFLANFKRKDVPVLTVRRKPAKN